MFKKLLGIYDTKRLWNSVAVEHLERSLAGVGMAVSDTSKFCVADFCGAAKGTINNGAAHLQRAQIGLGKSVTGEINRGERESLIIERRKIFCQQADLLELRQRRRNGLADICESEKIRWSCRWCPCRPHSRDNTR